MRSRNGCRLVSVGERGQSFGCGWRSTAVIISYDDSDGWCDHQMGPIVNHSSDPTYDALAGPDLCGMPLFLDPRSGQPRM